MDDQEYFSHLYEIASGLNQEFALPAALRKALQKTVEILDLETGWIWLAETDLKSVYLAASYNLPPALGDQPERLSGWCYCIDRYFSGTIEEATNISEITCSRLKDLTTGTKDLRFHATIPIITNEEKVGLINLLSKEKQQLDQNQLFVLNTISELIGIAIQRTRLQEANLSPTVYSNQAIQEVLNRLVNSRINDLIQTLQKTQLAIEDRQQQQALKAIGSAIQESEDLRNQLVLLQGESRESDDGKSQNQFHYPSSPLTSRELEVITLVKSGQTNAQIAERLFISERTVKFHVTSILSKLNAKTRTQAVDIALKRGLVSN